MSSSAKVWLQAAPDGSLRATKPWSQQPAAMRQAQRQKPCTTETQQWLERFHCQQCGEQRWWQIAFQPPSTYSVNLPEKQFRRGMQNGYGAFTRKHALISTALAGGRQ